MKTLYMKCFQLLYSDRGQARSNELKLQEVRLMSQPKEMLVDRKSSCTMEELSLSANIQSDAGQPSVGHRKLQGIRGSLKIRQRNLYLSSDPSQCSSLGVCSHILLFMIKPTVN